MDNKGQSLVLFVIIIPILLGVLAFVIDLGLINLEKDKLDNINIMVIEYGLENINTVTVKDLDDLIKENDSIVLSDISITSDSIVIILNKEVDSIFGNIINFKNYKIGSKYKGTIINDNIRIKRV